MTAIACCNFPTALLALDDDKEFLESIKYALQKKYKCICTFDADQAYDILAKNREWTKSLLEKMGIERAFPAQFSSSFSVEMDISSLRENVYNPDRFGHIAIVIVDYDMPKKNGLEFVRDLKDSTIKIIMLTGKAKQSTVIKAFNEGEIHRYVSKGDPNYLEIIAQYVDELQAEFFLDFSKFILESLKSETRVFEDNSFIAFFNKIIEENNIIEYYLLDESGSFFLQDASAKNQIFLIIKSENDMQHLQDLADDSDTPAHVLQQLKDRISLTHFNTQEESFAEVKDWKLIPAKPLDEKRKYYYAVLKNDKGFQMNRSKIKSYQEFLKQQS